MSESLNKNKIIFFLQLFGKNLKYDWKSTSMLILLIRIWGIFYNETTLKLVWIIWVLDFNFLQIFVMKFAKTGIAKGHWKIGFYFISWHSWY